MKQNVKAAQGLVTGAYVTTAIAIALLQTGLLLSFQAELPEELWVYFVGGGLATIIAMGLGFYGILKRTGGAGEHVLFSTWFPMFMAMVPVAGPIIALISVIKLLCGRIGPATITTTSGSSRSTSSYDALPLHGSGIPAGLLLLFLASLQPQIAWHIYQQEEASSDEKSPAPAVTVSVEVEPAVTRPQTAEEAQAARQRETWVIESLICQGVFECFTRADHVGPATGRLIVNLSAEGKASGVRVRLAGAPHRVAECIRSLGEGIDFDDYSGPGGELRCEFAGQVSGRVVSGEKKGRFIPRVER